MERTNQQQERQATAGGGGPTPGDSGLDQVRENLSAMHNEADQILNAFTPINAEAYLQQARQRGAE